MWGERTKESPEWEQSTLWSPDTFEECQKVLNGWNLGCPLPRSSVYLGHQPEFIQGANEEISFKTKLLRFVLYIK